MRRFYFDLVGSITVSDDHGLLFRDLPFAAHVAERLAADLFAVRPELRGTTSVVMIDEDRSDVYCVAIAADRAQTLRDDHTSGSAADPHPAVPENARRCAGA
jgi:hypothetical protein